MRRALTVLVVLLMTGLAALTALTGAAAGAASGRPAPAVRVLTFNIHHGAGADGAVDLGRIADVVRETRADVVGLQEVDRHWGERSAFADQARELARDLRMRVVFGANLDLDPATPGEPRRRYGTALLTRAPVLDHDNTPLPRFADHEQRGLLRARLLLHGRSVQVYVTHLQHNDAAEREAQAAAIVDLLGRHRDPAILVGDLNAQPGTPEIATLTTRLTDAWTAGGDGPGHTYPAEQPAARIDYVLVSPQLRTRYAEVIDTPAAVLASDHLPVLAVLTLPHR